jgi:hypothetical protein
MERDSEMARKTKHARWSYAEDRRLLEFAASSKSLEEIALLMKRSPAAVYKVARFPEKGRAPVHPERTAEGSARIQVGQCRRAGGHEMKRQ